jgi:hypothetical protein
MVGSLFFSKEKEASESLDFSKASEEISDLILEMISGIIFLSFYSMKESSIVILYSAFS